MAPGTEVLYVGEGTGDRPSSPVGDLDADVAHADSARAAVDLLRAESVDCVVSEQALPDATGLALLRAVRERWPDLPFLLCPADGSETLASEAVAAGVSRYVPLSAEDSGVSLAAAVADVTGNDSGLSKREQYEHLFEHAPVMYAVVRDADGEPVVEDCNERFLARLGYTREQVTGRSLAALYTEESAERLRSGGYRRALGGAFSPERHRLRTADGEVIEATLHASPRVDEDGDVVGILAMFIDQTEQKRRADRLELFRALLDQSNDEVFVIDPDTGAFVDVNRTACRNLGYDRETLLEMNVRDVSVSFSNREDWRDHVTDTSETGPLIVEDEHRRADGTTFPVEVNVTLVSLEREYVVAIARDVSERKRQQRRFRALIENATDLITVVEPDGTITYQSPSIERVLGYDPDGVTADSIFEYVHPEDHDRVSKAVADAVDGPRRVVYRARHADGTWRVLEGVVNDQLSDPAIGGYVVNSRDITERKDRERQLAVIDRVLRHNVRNDMDVVVGYAEAIEGRTDGEVADAARRIRRQGRGLLETIEKERDIVDVLMEGLDRDTVDVSAVAADVVDAVESTHSDAEFRTVLPETAPALSAGSRLREALHELVENAVVHSDRETPSIEVRVESTEDAVRVEVVDDGPGIPDDEVGVLTRDQEVAPLYHGSGMGLWLVNWIVARSGGSLSFRPRAPRGSVVTVELPRSESDPGTVRSVPDAITRFVGSDEGS